MKKIKKLVMALALVIAFAAVAPTFNIETPLTDEVSAGTATYSNIIIGDSFYYSVYGSSIKSVSFSKKGILKVTKKTAKKYTLKAKKAGSTKVTFKFKNGQKKTFKVNVSSPKSLKFTAISSTADGFINVKVKNTGKCSFNLLGYNYSLYDANGNLLTTKTATVCDLVAGSTAYDNIYVDRNIIAAADLSKTTFEYNADRSNTSFSYKYTRFTEKNKKVKVSFSYDPSTKKCKAKLTNKTKSTMSGYVDVLYYKNGQLVTVKSTSLYIKGKKSETKTFSAPYADFDSVKYSYRTYSKTYIK